MLGNMETEVTKLVAQIIEVPVEELKPDADFANDLGVDSMKAIEIAAAIEKKFRIIIPENDIPKVRNLRQALELTAKLMRA